MLYKVAKIDKEAREHWYNSRDSSSWLRLNTIPALLDVLRSQYIGISGSS